VTYRHRLCILLVAIALVAAGCGRGGDDDPLAIGVRRVPLNLVFAKEELKQPVAPEVIVRLLPPIEGLGGAADLNKFRGPPKFSLFPPCPEAPAGAGPLKPVLFAALFPPEVGSYARHNKGTIKINGAIPLTFPFPPVSRWDIPKTTRIVTPAAYSEIDPDAAPTVTYEWDVHKVLAPGFEQIDSLRLLADRIELFKRVTVTQGVPQEFNPSPPVRIYTFGDEGSYIASAGVDTVTNTSMAVEGNVERRENVDVCGQVIDTWRVTLTEIMVNLDTGETTGTNPQGERNVYNFANQYGGIVVREDLHYTQTTKAPDGTPVVLEFDYVSTLDDVKPKAIQP
jgi:hypothetical protein